MTKTEVTKEQQRQQAPGSARPASVLPNPEGGIERSSTYRHERKRARVAKRRALERGRWLRGTHTIPHAAPLAVATTARTLVMVGRHRLYCRPTL